ncbi:MAG: hypothetical protein QOJ15_527 [Bradyrhizobium sp.]|nr:hypothetical protein [Bradyrhizobium sp.]
MPTKYKPQLHHVGFDWCNQSDQFYDDLVARKTQILEKSGFCREYGHPGPGIVESEADELIRELAGRISLAAAIKVDAGFKAVNRLISTLEAVEKDPSLILTHDLEPEALGMLGLHYQRVDEPPGTFWFDVDRQVNDPRPEPTRVSRAASMAMLSLKSEAKSGRPADKVIEFLAVNFRAIFLRYNDSITRHSVATGSASQTEAGPFFEFLELVLTPLNRFFVSLPKHYGAAPVSAAYVARMAVELSQDQLQQQRPLRYRKAPDARSSSTQLFP